MMMSGIKNIQVRLNIEGEKLEVGELVLSNQKIYFRYHSQFLATKLNLSPINISFNREVNASKYEPFEGLFGLFNDSLPDAWGRLLLDRSLASKGIDISQIGPLDRLAFIGDSGVGALTYHPEYDINKDVNYIHLDEIAEKSNEILKGSSSELLEEIMMLGGSSGGARPKIFVNYDKSKDEITHGENHFPANSDPWIIKFPSSFDHAEIAKIEYAYYLMAKNAGIEMEESRLFEGLSGKKYFGTKRFDRIGEKRLHMHSASGLLHDNFMHSVMDYGHLMDLAFNLENHIHAYDKVFRLAAFNLYAHNRDDHSKNFSFLMNRKGEWKFAPAYDLTFSSSSYGFHATMFSGESKNPTKANLMKLANHFGMSNGNLIIEEVKDAISNWPEIAKSCKITRESISKIDSVLSNLLLN